MVVGRFVVVGLLVVVVVVVVGLRVVVVVVPRVVVDGFTTGTSRKFCGRGTIKFWSSSSGLCTSCSVSSFGGDGLSS